MTLTLDRPTTRDPIADAVATVEPAPDATLGPQVPTPRPLVLIWYSGDLEKAWASLILASTAAASGVPTKVFITFWGLQAFVKDEKRITGENAMQKLLAIMQRPGMKHRHLSKMDFLGMGPWMMGVLARQHGVASPSELLEACQALGVEFLPCQMTMDMFGLNPDDMIDGLAEPVGAATVIQLLADGAAPLFI